MAENLFGSAVPALGDAADGTTNYALGTRFTASVDGTVTHGRWRFPSTTPSASVQVQVGVYRVSDQVLLGSTSFPLLSTLGAWNEVAFPSPIPVTAGVTYVVVVWTPLRYVATASYAWPVSSASLTAGSANGWLTANPGALVFPSTQSGNSASYFADVVFEAATGSTLSASASGSASSSGAAAVTVTLAAAAAGASTSGGAAVIVGESIKATSTATVAGGTSTPALTAAAASTPVLTARSTSTTEVTRG